jgi:glycine/D-amino acid oxidase-like deaminating enzyme
MELPGSARFVVVGAGVHGLSTAYHLAEELGSGAEVVVLEKSRVGAGASGISGGIVRNFYVSPAMNELVRRSVELFEVDPSLFGFRQVGYVAVVPESQADELESIAEQHAEIGYDSTLVRGKEQVAAHLRGIFDDWREPNATALLHERRSGWADAQATVAALAGMTRSAGVRIFEGVEVTGFELSGDAVRRVVTSSGTIACEGVVVAPGPWARDLWRMLELDDEVSFHYWQVREGEYEQPDAALDPRAPVVHLDVDKLLRSPNGAELLSAPWGIYFRPGLGRAVACGGLPLFLDPECELDPYGPSHPELGTTSPEFDRSIEAGLASALGRFDGGEWRSTSFGAQTCFTPDSYPLVGFVRENAYVVLDSNHGFKLLALGQLAAAELAGRDSPELDPFRLDRFATAALHPASASPYPWT